MLGVEIFPALLYLQALFFIPRSPGWLATKEKFVEAKRVLSQTHSKQSCEKEILVKEKRIDNEKELSEVKWTDILKPGFRYII